MKGKRLLPLALLVLAIGLPTNAATNADLPAAKMDPKAMDLLTRMSDYLKGLDAFQVHVETTREGVLSSGEQLDSDQAFHIYVQRPDHLRIDHMSSAGNRQVYYDGKTLTVFTPKMNYYAVTAAPPTIAEVVMSAHRHGIDLPLSDFLAGHPVRTLTKHVTSSAYIGKSTVRGVETDHLAFRQKDIDWQLWIEDTDTPLPVKVVVTDKAIKGMPKFTAVMTQWNTSPSFDTGTFTFTPPPGARKIEFKETMGLPDKATPTK